MGVITESVILIDVIVSFALYTGNVKVDFEPRYMTINDCFVARRDISYD